MVKTGLSADIVVAKIKTSPGDYDTSPATLEKLKSAGIPDNVVLAMVEASAKTSNSSAPATTDKPDAANEIPSGKTRVYVSDSQSWLMAGGFGASNGTAAGAMTGGSSPQTVELIKTFGQRCPQAIVTSDREKANYVVLFDRDSFKGALARRDKIAIFRRNGDVLFSNSVRSVGNAVKDACEAITKESGRK
ncbi:MAG: hypothetical protein WBD73_09620 [Candidatus Acidiferrales bacterium]